MSKRPSLLETQQPGLFTGSADLPHELFTEREAVGEFTGARLFSQRPDTYEQVVAMLGEGMSVRAIARVLKVSTNTIAAVRDREGSTVETHKKETVATMRRFIRLAAERLVDEVDKIPLQSLPIALGIAIEKSELLDGGATARVEHTQAPADDDFLNMVATMKRADAHVVASETGVQPEGEIQKALLSTSLTQATADGCPPECASSDMESDDPLCKSPSATDNDTEPTPPTASATHPLAPLPGTPGGEGGRSDFTPPHMPIG